MKLGLDVGGVLLSNQPSAPVEEWPVPSQEVILFVKRIQEDNEVIVLSACGLKTQEKTRIWLAQWFPSLTEIVFVKKAKQKAGMAQSLNLEAMIDDREDVLAAMNEVGIKGFFPTDF